MVLKTDICRFSGLRIYPGHGMRFVRVDSALFIFLNAKCARYFHNRLKPAKLSWTVTFRKQHKKDQGDVVAKKKRRASAKPFTRSIVGASLEVIQKRRTEKSEVRAAARDAALREVKERNKKVKEEKKSKKTDTSKGKGAASSKAAPRGGAAPTKLGKAGKR